MSDDLKKAAQRKGDTATFMQTFSAVLWSFLGVRKGKGHADDMAKLNPIHVILVGLLAAALFVFGLIAIVNLVVP